MKVMIPRAPFLHNNDSSSSFKTIIPARTVRDVSSNDPVMFEQAQRKLELVLEMQAGLKSKTYDRRWRDLKVYKQCFLHSDAISWIMHHHNEEEEAEAVVLANELVDLQYISHVCNNHRFKVKETRTLYFKFGNDVIQADLQSIQRRRQQEQEQKTSSYDDYGHDDNISDIQHKMNRLGHETSELGKNLAEAHGKIAMLEAIVVSLGFSILVVMMVLILVASLVLWKNNSTIMSLHYNVLLGCKIVTIVVGILLPITLMMGTTTTTKPWKRMMENMAIMRKLVATTTTLDDAIMMDDSVDSVSETTTTTPSMTIVVGGHQQQQKATRHMTSKRDSLVVQMIKSVRLASTMRKESVRPIKMKIVARDASDLPDVSTWPHRPVLLCVNTPVSPSLRVPTYGTGPCPLGVPFQFSTDLFEGVCLVRLRDVPSSDDMEGDERYFEGRKRRFQAIVQGKFKEVLPVADVLTGHEFVRPLQHLPPPWILRAGTNLIRRLAPGADICLDEEQAHALSILAATSQIVSVDQPGNEPEITSNDIEEDVSLFGGIFAKGQVSTFKRKHYLADPKHSKNYYFDTESVYTFDFYQSLLDVATYSLDLGFKKISLTRVVDGQPIQVMSKTVDGRYLWDFQVWHEKLLPPSPQ